MAKQFLELTKNRKAAVYSTTSRPVVRKPVFDSLAAHLAHLAGRFYGVHILKKQCGSSGGLLPDLANALGAERLSLLLLRATAPTTAFCAP